MNVKRVLALKSIETLKNGKNRLSAIKGSLNFHEINYGDELHFTHLV